MSWMENESNRVRMIYTVVSFGFLVNGMNVCCNVPQIAIL